jgi:1L-myo-inositol 1-phosphate cytidylyltransferase
MKRTAKECLILAAGNGNRIASLSGGSPKPLVPLFGAPLLEHIVLSAQAAGIEKFVIVVGYRADAFRAWLAERRFENISITIVENPDYQKPNGVSALAAKGSLRNPFLLLMADHIFEPSTARRLLRQPLGDDEVILGVDYKIERIFDLDDATKVKVEMGSIVDIGKDLDHYNALDTGMFLCGPSVFASLEAAQKSGNSSLSDGMRKLCEECKLKAFDIGDGHWQDVDTPEALAYTESIFERDFTESPILQGGLHV